MAGLRFGDSGPLAGAIGNVWSPTEKNVDWEAMLQRYIAAQAGERPPALAPPPPFGTAAPAQLPAQLPVTSQTSAGGSAPGAVTKVKSPFTLGAPVAPQFRDQTMVAQALRNTAPPEGM